MNSTDSFAAQDTRGDSDMNFWVRCPPKSHAPPSSRLSEFDFRVLGDGRSASARYANNSNYRNDSLIRKESEWSDGTQGHDDGKS